MIESIEHARLLYRNEYRLCAEVLRLPIKRCEKRAQAAYFKALGYKVRVK